MMRFKWMGLILAFTTPLLAQNYQCSWQVNGIAGGELAGGNYRCGATLGQTATGLMTGENLLALIGFWQPEALVGLREATNWSTEQALKTRLYIPVPNPFRGRVTIRYTLNAEHNALLQIHDITGRVVRTLVNSKQRAGRYQLLWDGKDCRGRTLPAGVYFCRFRADDYQQNLKLILQR